MRNLNANKLAAWWPIPGHEKYFINAAGKVFSQHTKKFIKPHRNFKGGRESRNRYLKFEAYDGQGNQKKVYLHRAVAMTFLPPPPSYDGYDVHHIDGNHLNNRADNLRWMSHSDHSTLTMKAKNTHAHTRKKMGLKTV